LDRRTAPCQSTAFHLLGLSDLTTEAACASTYDPPMFNSWSRYSLIVLEVMVIKNPE